MLPDFIDPSRVRQQQKAEARYQRSRQARHARLKEIYGVTIEEATEMLVGQNYMCPICDLRLADEVGKDAQIEHCHKTGRVRGIVCLRCNLALGWVGDDIDKLRRMIDYLSKT